MMKDMKIDDIEKQELEISPEIASGTLKSVFEACEKPQNTIPLELLEGKYKNQTKFYVIANIIAIIGLILVSIAIILYSINMWDRNFKASIDTEYTIEESKNLQPPDIIDTSFRDGKCIIELKQGTYPIEYDSIYAIDQETNSKFMVQHEDNKIFMPYTKESKIVIVYITDEENNKYNLSLIY